MRSRSQGKKGFTIVELVIVIAVIAILAAVLIPTFIGLTKKANNSADMQMVTNINKQLAAAELLEGKNVTMHDAVMDAASAGYNLTALLSANNSENTILWSQEYDRFFAVNEKGKVVAGKEDVEFKKLEDYGKDITLWTISTTVAEDSKYSVYYCGEDNADITTAVGFDAGDKVVNVTYTGNADVIIRTNIKKNDSTLIGNLTVNNAEGSVTHYGMVNELTVENAKTYTECGYVYNITKAWNGTFKANGAQFHQPAKTEEKDGTKKVIGVEELVKVEGTASYGVHYDADNNKVCDLCNKNTCDHKMSDPVVVPATCETKGTSFSQCSTCGYVKYIVTDELNHDWKEFGAIDATCTTAGQKAGKVCLRCGKKEEGEVIYPLGHDFSGATDDTFACKHGCGLTLGQYKETAVTVTSLEDLKNIDWEAKGIDKRKDLVTIILGGDLEIKAHEFTSIFGTDSFYSWSENGETNFVKSMNAMFAVDLNLAGHKLTVEAVQEDFNGLYVYGQFRINGILNSNKKGELILKGKPEAGAFINTDIQNSNMKFDDVNVTSDIDLISGAPDTKVEINNTNWNLNYPDVIYTKDELNSNDFDPSHFSNIVFARIFTLDSNGKYTKEINYNDYMVDVGSGNYKSEYFSLTKFIESLYNNGTLKLHAALKNRDYTPWKDVPVWKSGLTFENISGGGYSLKMYYQDKDGADESYTGVDSTTYDKVTPLPFQIRLYMYTKPEALEDVTDILWNSNKKAGDAINFTVTKGKLAQGEVTCLTSSLANFLDSDRNVGSIEAVYSTYVPTWVKNVNSSNVKLTNSKLNVVKEGN